MGADQEQPVVARVAEARMAHGLKRVERAVEAKIRDRARRVEQLDQRASPAVHASQQPEALVPAGHVNVLAAGLRIGSAPARHETKRVEQADQGMQNVVPAARWRADFALARHGPGRVELADLALSESMAAVEAMVCQEPTVPAGLPEIETVVGPAYLQWRAVVALVRRLAD